MQFSDFIFSLSEGLATSLGSMGFMRQDDCTYIRLKESREVNVLSFQKHSSKPAVSVNFGVHYTFLPKLGSKDLPLDGRLNLSECEIKVRLTPSRSENDYWWPLSKESINQIVDMIDQHMEKFFQNYNMNSAISRLSNVDLEEQLPEIVGMLTKVRACLILARIHEELGDESLAKAFAHLGVKAAGMAVGPKKALKEILKRVKGG